MTSSYILLLPAIRDFARARNWYDGQRSGLGDEFQRAMWAHLEQIGDDPQAGAPVGWTTGVHRLLAHRFPYHIVYLAERPAVIILIRHARRDPSTLRRDIRKRLRQRS